MKPPSRRVKITALVAVCLLCFMLSSAIVWKASYAAFTATTTNGANAMTAGTVTLTNDYTAQSLFNPSPAMVTPNKTGSTCLTVTFTGNVASQVKLYSSGLTGTGLGTYINLTVDEGTGTAHNCSDFSGGTNLYTGTIAGFDTAKNSFANGVSSWTPSSNGDKKTYKVTWTVQDNQAAMSLTCTLTFTWEARNT